MESAHCSARTSIAKTGPTRWKPGRRGQEERDESCSSGVVADCDSRDCCSSDYSVRTAGVIERWRTVSRSKTGGKCLERWSMPEVEKELDPQLKVQCCSLTGLGQVLLTEVGG